MSPYVRIAPITTAPCSSRYSRGSCALTPPACNGARVRLPRVGDAVRHDPHAVTVPADVIRDLGRAVERARHDEADVALPQRVRHPIALTGLRTRVRLDGEAEAGREELGRVAGVAHPPFDMVEPEELRGGARARLGARRAGC